MIDLPPPVPAIEFSVASTGMSKGLAQTEDPQFLARGELAFGDLYLGAYAKNVTSSTSDGEAAALVGARTKAAGFDLAASASLKRAINPASGSDKSALEVSGSVARRSGKVTPRLSLVWSPDDLGSTERTLFVEASASYRLTAAVSATAAVGRRERGGGPDYTAWNAGISWNPAKPVTLDLRYYDSDGGPAHAFKPRIVASGRLRF